MKRFIIAGLVIFLLILALLIVALKDIFEVVNEAENINQNILTNEIEQKEEKLSNIYEEQENYTIILEGGENKVIHKKSIDDWRLVLVNYDNVMKDDFSVELANIDRLRQFDARAIGELTQMIKDMKAQGFSNIWAQSTYRSLAKQEEVFNEKKAEHMSRGLTEEEAERLTMNFINKPGTSEHNLGLAVDFNNVKVDFKDTKEYQWLLENAENYGFVLRYPEDKVEITKVNYEPWHWRYVGAEHAKKMNELNMCLEEYINYLSVETN